MQEQAAHGGAPESNRKGNDMRKTFYVRRFPPMGCPDAYNYWSVFSPQGRFIERYVEKNQALSLIRRLNRDVCELMKLAAQESPYVAN